MFIDQFLHHHPFGQRRIFHALQHAAIEQEARLAGVTQHLETGLLPSQRDAAEVDVRGDVFLTHVLQRIGVEQVSAVAHDRAHAALRVVILVFGKTVVQQKHRARLQPVGQGAHKRLGLRVDFGQVVVAARHVERRPQGRRLIGVKKNIVMRFPPGRP